MVLRSQRVVVVDRLNRKTKFHLDNDLSDKFQAISIDTHNTGLHVTSKNTQLDNTSTRISSK